MIGHFAFNDEGLPDHIIVAMVWTPSGESGCVIAPPEVVEKLRDLDIGVRGEDEVMSLSFALSYGVMLATLAEAPLCLAGDRSVWPEEWGSFIERDDRLRSEVKSRQDAERLRPYGLD
jgi:hypothetical protein